MTITTSSLVRDGDEAVDFVSDRIQAPEGALATDRVGLAEVRPPFQNLREQAAAHFRAIVSFYRGCSAPPKVIDHHAAAD